MRYLTRNSKSVLWNLVFPMLTIYILAAKIINYLIWSAYDRAWDITVRALALKLSIFSDHLNSHDATFTVTLRNVVVLFWLKVDGLVRLAIVTCDYDDHLHWFGFKSLRAWWIEHRLAELIQLFSFKSLNECFIFQMLRVDVFSMVAFLFSWYFERAVLLSLVAILCLVKIRLLF